MYEEQTVPRHIGLTAWIDQARADPVRHVERQVTAILLHAVGITPELRASLVLKGGILMSIAHGSYRQTGDVDFTAITDPEPYASRLKQVLDQALPAAAAELGFVDLVCVVQRFEYRPRQHEFADAPVPGLQLAIGYARRGTSDEARLKARRSTRVLQIDISFREQVVHPSELQLEDTEVTIQAYDIEDIIAEKYRALLQQVIRNRSRRQDVYDIDWLLSRYTPDVAMQAEILATLLKKAEGRDLIPTPASIDNPEVGERAAREWDTMRLEIGSRLPDFDETFAKVAAFYRNLPWG